MSPHPSLSVARSPSVLQSGLSDLTAREIAQGVLSQDSGQPFYRVDAPGFPNGADYGLTLIDLLAGNFCPFFPPSNHTLLSLSRNSGRRFEIDLSSFFRRPRLCGLGPRRCHDIRGAWPLLFFYFFNLLNLLYRARAHAAAVLTLPTYPLQVRPRSRRLI